LAEARLSHIHFIEIGWRGMIVEVAPRQAARS